MQHFFLSPHMDDVALSCGGRVAQLTARGAQVQVLTIMSGKPTSGPLSPFALKTHQDWGNPEDMIATRLSEDARAMSILGVRHHYLNWADAMYRRGPEGENNWLYTSNDTLFAPLHPAEIPLMGPLAADIARWLSSPGQVRIYAPMGAGSHVDHLLIRGAVLLLWQQGYEVVCYEEIPYVMWPGALAKALADLPSPLVGESYILSDEEFATRLAAVDCYRSQLVGVFGSFEATVPMLTDYVEKVGAGAGKVERFWRLPSFQDTVG